VGEGEQVRLKDLSSEDKKNILKFYDSNTRGETLSHFGITRYTLEKIKVELDYVKSAESVGNCISKSLKTAWSTDKEGILRKRKETWMNTLGVDNPVKSDKVLSKIVATNLDKYGVEFAVSSAVAREKAKSTNLKRFGVENAAASEEIKDKIASTNLERYGVRSTASLPEVKDKMMKTLIDSGRVKFIDGQRIGEFAESIGYSGSRVAYLLHHYGEDYVKNLGDKGQGKTSIEVVIGSFLDELGVRFIHDRKLTGTSFRPDFYLPDHNLVIECDGLYWHSEAEKDNKYHRDKRIAVNRLGIRLLAFYEDEILEKAPIVKSIITHALGLTSKKVFGRHCSLVEVPTRESVEFFEANHLMGKGSGRTLGLTVGGELVSAVRVRNKGLGVEISRFSSKIGVSVVGGQSKLLKAVEREFRPEFIENFVDLRYGMGNQLDGLGFKLVSEGASFYWTDCVGRFHRMAFPGNSGSDKRYLKLHDYGQANYTKKINS
jgi:very-short-patch-repair endonuclease